MQLNFKAFQDAIKQYCIDHVDVQHNLNGRIAFCRMESNEDANAIRTHGGPVLVVMDDFSGRSVGSADDRQLVQTARIIFVAYANPKTADNPSAIEQAQQLAMDVMLQFEARMWNEYLQDDCGTFKHMLWELTSYEPMDGPWLTGYYGWILTVNFKTIKQIYDAAKWTP